jgi:hypothetical protein
MIAWDDILGKKIPYGLVVEGKTDKKVIEQFLKASGWANWQSQVSIQVCYGNTHVVDELKRGDTRIWGLIEVINSDSSTSAKIPTLIDFAPLDT